MYNNTLYTSILFLRTSQEHTRKSFISLFRHDFFVNLCPPVFSLDLSFLHLSVFDRCLFHFHTHVFFILLSPFFLHFSSVFKSQFTCKKAPKTIYQQRPDNSRPSRTVYSANAVHAWIEVETRTRNHLYQSTNFASIPKILSKHGQLLFRFITLFKIYLFTFSHCLCFY